MAVQLAAIERLRAENENVEPGRMSTSTGQQVVALLADMFTQEDWQAMAETVELTLTQRRVVLLRYSQSEPNYLFSFVDLF